MSGRGTKKKNLRLHRCYYCARQIGKCDPKSASFYTIDHRTPKSRGGSNSPLNRVPCCRLCNTTKANMTENEFRLWMSAGRPNKVDYMRKIGLIPDRPVPSVDQDGRG